MKKIIFVYCLVLHTLLFGLEITIVNKNPEISEDRGFTIVSVEDSFFPQNEGEPAVPVRSIFFEISVVGNVSPNQRLQSDLLRQRLKRTLYGK